MYRDESKNFYYDIKISTPDGKRSARLTDTLMKMCNKVDIIEALISEKSQSTPSATVSFIEADFLPDSGNKTPIEGVEGRGYITNRTGALIDIRFDSEKGFTYVTPAELDSGLSKSSRSQNSKSEPVVFMFSANNMIEITWGHLEPRTSRTKVFKIGVVSYAAGVGGNILTLQCVPTFTNAASFKLSEGKAFVDANDNPRTLKQVLYDICSVFGARLIFDKQEVPQYPPTTEEYILDRTKEGGDTIPTSYGYPLYLIRQVDIDTQIKEMATRYNSIYEIYDDPITGTPVVEFTSEKLRFPKSVRTLNYRDPDGVMLDFQLNSMEGMLSKTSNVSAIDETGKAESEYTDVRLTTGNDEVPHTFEPIPLVYNDKARTILKRELVGMSMTAPNTSASNVKSLSEMATRNRSFLGYITVKTIGHPDFKPDLMKITGIGVRASATYRMFSVQHSLSSSGYICTMQGMTQESVEQGLNNEDQVKKNKEYTVTQLTTGRE